MTTKRILVVYGTRPEAIKLAPLIERISMSQHLEPIVAVTGQHRAMLDQVNRLFGIHPSHDLDIIAERQTLESVTVKALSGVSGIISEIRPDAVVVQGDTSTCFAAALSAFYNQVPVVHLEAGLRTNERYNPFPEEINRRLTTQLASLHLAPTQTSRRNLEREGVPPSSIVVTGNTVIDALINVVSRDIPVEDARLAEFLDNAETQPMLLVTSHRRESWGEPMRRTAMALASLARSHPNLSILLPAHLNPRVREVLLPPLDGLTNIVVTEPLTYSDFSQALNNCTIVLTDSGGVQEEAPSLGKPVLVTRDTTERPEAVDAGTVHLVGTEPTTIVNAVTSLLTDEGAYRKMARAVNPYGDGSAAPRAVAAIENFFGYGPRPSDFNPS